MVARLKIAIYHNLHSGGAKRTLGAITQRLAQRHELDLYELSCSDREFCEVGSANGTVYTNTSTYPFTSLPQLRKPLGRFNFAARLVDIWRLERLQRRIASEIDNRQYDVVYVHPCQFTQAPSLLRYLHTPALYHCQEPLRVAYEPRIPRPYDQRGRAKQLLDRYDPMAALYHRRRTRGDCDAVRAATLIVANSFFARESIYRCYGVNARVCYLGVDTHKFRPLDIPRNGAVLSVGALTPNKGFDFIVKSLARIPVEMRPSLTIVCNYQEPGETNYICGLAKQNGLNLRVIQRVSDDALIRLYNQAPLVVYAPILEPFGLVPIEAMACSTPVVAVAEGGVRESIRHGETGLLVDRDTTQFAMAVQQLLTDPQTTMTYGYKARDYVVQNWGWEQTVTRLEDLLATLASH